MRALPALVGLLVSLGGVTLLAGPAQRLLGDPERLRTKWFEQLALWALFAVVLAIVLLWEQAPLASIGLRPLAWASLRWAIALAVWVAWVAAPIGAWAASRAGLATFEAGVADFARWPLGYRGFAVLTAGVVEETLFRGFALERIAAFTGSHGLAGLVPLAVFVLVHGPFWGPGAMLALCATGGSFAAFYVWRQDLLANVLAHVVVDATGLIVMPALSRRSRSRPDAHRCSRP